jgi:hypothetical protein
MEAVAASPAWKPPPSVVDEQYAAALKCCEDTLNSLEPSCSSETTGNSSDNSTNMYTPRVPVRTYGPNVEVYVSRSLKPPAEKHSANNPFTTSTPIDASSGTAASSVDGGDRGRGVFSDDFLRSSSPARGVHFSPVVSEVNWRESYVEQELDFDNAPAHVSASEAGIVPGGRRNKRYPEDGPLQNAPQKVKVR